MARSVLIDPLFGDRGKAMVDLAVGVGRYRTYAEHERIETDLGRGLPQRYDSVQNFVRSGGRAARRSEAASTLTARTSYLREEYAYGSERYAAGIDAFLHHPSLIDGARTVHGCDIVEPAIAYANVMLPGQELAVHTDVPEFRGLNRKLVPQWLLVVMHHAGLFDAWRLRIATGIGWFSDGPGGELSWWPSGADGPAQVHDGRPDTALVLDTDTVFHGVDTVGGIDQPAPPIEVGSTLTRDRAAAAGEWMLANADGYEVARYLWAQLRLSVSWKAYCFSDEAERTAWRIHSDDLSYEAVVDELVADMHARGVVEADPCHDRALGLAMIDTYIRFPST
ncbi:MAG: hypothetical protein ACR2LQ_00745 [Acidimicrobiales bacterium]